MEVVVFFLRKMEGAAVIEKNMLIRLPLSFPIHIYYFPSLINFFFEWVLINSLWDFGCSCLL